MYKVEWKLIVDPIRVTLFPQESILDQKIVASLIHPWLLLFYLILLTSLAPLNLP